MMYLMVVQAYQFIISSPLHMAFITHMKIFQHMICEAWTKRIHLKAIVFKMQLNINYNKTKYPLKNNSKVTVQIFNNMIIVLQFLRIPFA